MEIRQLLLVTTGVDGQQDHDITIQRFWATHGGSLLHYLCGGTQGNNSCILMAGDPFQGVC
jgi:hypothetical protein